MRDGLELDAALAHRGERVPVEDKTRGRRLEGDGRPRDARPHVPERERRRHVRVLYRPAVTRQPGPDLVRAAVEEKRDQARVAQNALDGGAKWAENDLIAG